jgi:ubiquitin
MIKPSDRPGPRPPTPPVRHEQAKDAREKAESAEVIGRHKNDGPKDHKGAR